MDTTTAATKAPPANEAAVGRLSLDDRLKVWDMVIKGAGGLILVVGALWGYLDYRSKEDQRRAEDVKYRETKDAEAARYQLEHDLKAKEAAKQQHKEFMLKLYEERRPLYGEACRAAAQIVTADVMAEAKPAIKKFLELYYGELCLVEDLALEKAMINFKALLANVNDKSPPSPAMRRAALQLAMAAQKGLNLADVFDIKNMGDQSKKLGGELSLKEK